MSDHVMHDLGQLSMGPPPRRVGGPSAAALRAMALCIPPAPLLFGWATGMPVAVAVASLVPSCIAGFYAAIHPRLAHGKDAALPLYPLLTLVLSTVVFAAAHNLP